jgi:hypothetical protein
MITIQKAVEEIKQVFPIALESQIIYDLDRAQKDFVNETEYLETYAQLEGIEDNLVWELPDDYNSFIELLLYDVNGNQLYFGDYQLDYEIQYGNLYIKTTGGTPITKIPDAIKSIYLGYRNKPTDLTVITDTWSVLDEHIEGITAKVYKSYYAKFPVEMQVRGEIIKARDVKMVMYWQQEETAGRVKAKRYINSKNKIELRGAFNYGMAGKFVTPLHNEPTDFRDIVLPAI